ncbi:MAG: SAM-dependent methyltransferase [Clostridia bacterium]|nr:SAM-dependent methyltransferase [Clostridia bacterium]
MERNEYNRIPELPGAFLSRMRDLLGERFAAFLSAMDEPPVRGMRVNPACGAGAPEGLPIRPIPGIDGGFFLELDERIGRHPLHHAGAFYLQEPAAMLPVAAAVREGLIPRGARALDLCAAPGGKTFQIASAVGEDGLLVSNEIVPSRCAVLAGNVERLGLRRVIVANTEPRAFGEYLPGYFDVLVVDAPCSGEGMFRKTPEAVKEWNPASPASCAARQRAILSAALPSLKEGGTLVYSTCTYSPEENEETVSWLLREYPVLSLIPVTDETILSYTDPGLEAPGVPAGATRRHYPHSGGGLFGGEGQFFALFRLTAPIGGAAPKTKKGGGEAKQTRDALALGAAFLSETLTRLPAVAPTVFKDKIVLSPAPLPLPANLIYANGVTVGEIRSGRLAPHHAFFSAYGRDFIRKLDFPADDPTLAAYLHGDVIPARDLFDGWGVVLCLGTPIGGVRITGGVAKNHYPKGLRRQ